ncbi:hypothetical protein [Parerythrobacter jejuensis]|uniref:Uncharacterized protein n=1 Tax=Parerythrobacter jejuensis TaxID=795812 RepID=A0A845ALP1_9SPHN|nr:hypothetical protein [Parerythrobacter jejuensis]MXP30337.1 hypothetical protein [Parerythrobacter jejuensis]MXP33097.1 hypothetical protein [Parerythrobacter jejuensis]
MATAATLPAWIALFLGLYTLAACVAELRTPGGWDSMIAELDKSFLARLISGAFALTLGATIYLVTPWNPDDWLSILISVIGGLAVAKGLVLIAAGDRTVALYNRFFKGRTGLIAGIDAVLGAALVFVAMSRLQYT